MYTVRVESALGSLVLTQNEPQWQLISITGLNPPKAQINTTTIAGMDGAHFNSSKLGTRNIVLTIRINGDVESNRLLLYRMFRTKETVTFFYQHNSINVMISGYVDTVECNIFKNGEQMQVSVVCPFPYFQSVKQNVVDVSNFQSEFEFPFSIDLDDPVIISSYEDNRVTNVYNNSETVTGATIEVDVTGLVESFTITNSVTGEFIGIDYLLFDGDKVLIDTVKGQKNVTLVRENVSQSIFGALRSGSTFLQLQPGNNEFWYQVDDGSWNQQVSVKFKFRTLYRGV